MRPIARGPFLLSSVVLFWTPVALAIVMGLAAGIYDRITGTSGGTPALSAAGLIIFLALAATCVAAMLWLVARRAKTVGWNPLVTALLFVPLSVVVWLALLFKDESPTL